MAKTASLAKAKRHNEIQAYMLIILQVLGFFIFSIYPILWVFRYGFYDYDGVTAQWCGFENYIRAFTRDPLFWKSIINTFIIGYGKLIVEIPLSFIVALALTSGFVKMKRVFMVGYYLPKMTGIAVNCMIFLFLFRGYKGPVNEALKALGIINADIAWFSAKWTAIIVIMVRSAWVGFSTNMLYFMAGVSNVSEDVMEAAKVDGANRAQCFFKITLPMLAPVIKTILMLAMVGSMKMNQDVMLLTNGAPGGETNVVMLYLYQLYFEASTAVPQYGYASALGVVTTFIIGGVTLIYLKLTKKADSVY
ncbi:MAG: sugar ABC transporter permease [Clostridia bacterium]|nr:sugar ABC transporter permease [Clostridia bacterium]